MQITEESIRRLREFLVMAKKVCMGAVIPGFQLLSQKDIENIFEMCL